MDLRVDVALYAEPDRNIMVPEFTQIGQSL